MRGLFPLVTQILPGWVGGFDEGDLFAAEPAFDLFFSGDGVACIVEGLEVYQAGDVVFLGETGDEFVFVLVDATLKLAGDAGVEGTGGAAHDVDEVLFHGL